MESFASWNGEDAIRIADDDVARCDALAADGDGDVDLTRAVLVGTPVRDAPSVNGEVRALGGIAIANGAIDHESGDALPHGQAEHDLAHDRVGEVAGGVDDDHVACTSEIDRFVRHEVVTRSRSHRDGRAE